MACNFENADSLVAIKVIGVGGGGGNTVNRMIQDDVQSVEFIAANTDSQDLSHKSLARKKILLGEKATNGRGAGANPDVGRRAAEESREQIVKALEGSEMVFITAGMGGGTGTGAAPLIAEVAKEMGILTIGVVTKPFGFEGNLKMRRAEKGIEDLKAHVDSLIVIPNERLKYVADDKISLTNAFSLADSVLKQGVRSITDLIQGRGILNLDFADVCAVTKDAGYAHMCVASAKGKDKAEEAAKKAVVSPLLETSVTGAKGIIINFTADPDIALEDIYRAAEIIREEADPDANIIWGVVLDESMKDELKVTIIATGFEDKQMQLNASANSVKPVFRSMPVHPVIPSSVVPESINAIVDAEAKPRLKHELNISNNTHESPMSSPYCEDDAEFMKLLEEIRQKSKQ